MNDQPKRDQTTDQRREAARRRLEPDDYLSRSQADAVLLKTLADAMAELLKATDGWLFDRMQPHLAKLEEARRRSFGESA